MIKTVSAIPVLAMQDTQRAFNFYSTVFGGAIEEYNSDNGLWWLVLNDSRIILYQSDTPVTSKHTSIRFVVEDIQSAIAEVQNYGLSFFGTKDEYAVDFGSHYSAWFKDTEGNSIELTQLK